MTDPTDPGGVSSRTERGRTTRVGDAGSPIASPLTIVLAVLAVLGGALILRSVRDTDALVGGATPPAVGETTVAPTAPGATTAATAAPVTTAAPAPTRSGATVVVTNAAFSQGAAGALSTALTNATYTVADPVDPDTDVFTDPATTTAVYYDSAAPAAQAVATQLATDLGTGAAQPMPAPIPVEGGSLGGAQVLVVLGLDKVGATVSGAGAAVLPSVPNNTTTVPA